MESTRLLSEGFEKAAYALHHSMDNFSTYDFVQAVDKFAHAVNKLQQIEAMKAANYERADRGLAQAYPEAAFDSIQ